MSRDDIVEKLKESKPYLERHFHVRKIGFFGSFARNEQTETSDLDLLIEFEADIKNIHQLKNELRQYLNRLLHRHVDLARVEYLKSYVKNDIVNQAIYV